MNEKDLFVSAIDSSELVGGTIDFQQLGQMFKCGISKTTLTRDTDGNPTKLRIEFSWCGVFVDGILEKAPHPLTHIETTFSFAKTIEHRGKKRSHIEFELGTNKWTWFFEPKGDTTTTFELARGV